MLLSRQANHMGAGTSHKSFYALTLTAGPVDEVADPTRRIRGRRFTELNSF